MIIKTFQVGDKFNGLTISSSIYKTMIESGNKRRFWPIIVNVENKFG